MSLLKKRHVACDALKRIVERVEKQLSIVPALLNEQAFSTQLSAHVSTQMLADLSLQQRKLSQALEAGANLSDAQLEQHFRQLLVLEQAMLPLLKEIDAQQHEIASSAAVTALLPLKQAYQEQANAMTAAVQFYNLSVRELNAAVIIFPGSIIALLMRISRMPLFPLSERLDERY